MKTPGIEVIAIENARRSENGQYTQHDDDHDQFNQRKALPRADAQPRTIDAALGIINRHEC